MSAQLASELQYQPAAARNVEPDGRVPVVLGVTGHRTIRRGDEGAVTVHLREPLDRLRRDLPHSPVILLTSLAEGADRLVARVALDAGVQLIVVLPLPQDIYERDFTTAESRGEFRALLAHPRTERCIVAPVLDPRAETPGNARDLQYLLSGLFIARHSDILIAIWDGAPARGMGGTGQIVDFRRRGRIEIVECDTECLAAAPEPFNVLASPLDAPPTGLIFHVSAPKPDDTAAPNGVTAQWLVPERHDDSPVTRAQYRRHSWQTLGHRETFNSECVSYRANHGPRVAAARALLTRGELDADASTAATEESFAVADVIAIRHQQETYRTLIALFYLVAFATLSLLFRDRALTEDAKRAYLAGYLLLLAIADVLYLRTRSRASQDRFQDYRALAEGLRVQFFWRLAGLQHAAADYYLRKQRNQLSWIRDSLRACALRAAPHSPGRIAEVALLWVTDQRAYYERASRRDGLRRHRLRMAGSALVLFSLCVTVGLLWNGSAGRPFFLGIAGAVAAVLVTHLGFEIATAAGESQSFDRKAAREMFARGALGAVLAGAVGVSIIVGGPLLTVTFPRLEITGATAEWTLASVGITALIGAFVHAYANIRAFGEHEKQYERMEELFRSAEEALRHAASGSAARERVLFDLGCEALAEHADWLLLHRERPIELPSADI